MYILTVLLNYHIPYTFTHLNMIQSLVIITLLIIFKTGECTHRTQNLTF